MPKTCRTDTFMSGKPAGSSTLVMAAVVINPPRSRGTFAKPDVGVWLRMGYLTKPIRAQRIAEARRPSGLPLLCHKDRQQTRFLKGCSANSVSFLPNKASEPPARLLEALSNLLASLIGVRRG